MVSKSSCHVHQCEKYGTRVEIEVNVDRFNSPKFLYTSFYVAALHYEKF
jgi:hypothetical protein